MTAHVRNVRMEPQRNPETEIFWDACNSKRLLIKRCKSCAQAHYYPRALCPLCSSSDCEWEESSGYGSVYAFSVMRRTNPPLVLAYVTLDEGISMLTNIVDVDPDRVEINQRVRVAFRPAAGSQFLPMFTPV